MIQVRVRMIRAGQSRSGTAREELENGEKFGVDFEGEKVGKSKIHELHTESTDQNKQNILKTNKSQKNLGLFLVGIFGFRTKTTKSS